MKTEIVLRNELEELVRLEAFVREAGEREGLSPEVTGRLNLALEEAVGADLILNVCDVSSPEFDQQLEVTTGLLKELGAENVPVLTVLNKCDKLPELPMTLNKSTAAISAKTGEGLDKLLEKIVLNLPETHRHLHLLIPYDKSGLIGEIRQTGKVYTEEYRADGTFLDANVDLKICHRVQDYILLNEE